ncbi:FAD-binding protein [Isoptericola sp. NPDC056578]|uniref:FAD-binding protein n=1 Tax=Isoptericola sp. NPDC056578 TaxID=3345870 RepID=UPI0036BBE86E
MSGADALEAWADVLVLGGGPAGTWAALAAAGAGAEVVLADKGYCGTSGATASGGNNLWLVEPGEARVRAARARAEKGGHLTDDTWMARVLETTWEQLDVLAAKGYPFPHDAAGAPVRSSLQGPEYMRRMRRAVHRAGVRLLDHHPALELVADRDGLVSGAAGVARQDGGRPWRVRARAVVVATGGCAALAGGFGTNVDTGEGVLMAVEAGAELSGMEFSTAYALAPEWGVHTKGRMLQWATFYDERGEALGAGDDGPGRQLAQSLLVQGQRVYARLDRAPREIHQKMRDAQPNYFVPLDKAGVDPFTTAYPLRMVYEGTVRGTGGLRVVTDDCATTVPGLYAAGDAATRELVTGAISGGGSHNGAWAISSGTWAGRGAARFALARGGVPDRVDALGRAGLRPSDGAAADVDAREVIAAAQRHVLPPARTVLRTAAGLRASQAELETLWGAAVPGLAGEGRERLRARVAASLVAHARWVTTAALARGESRGMHRRVDAPAADPRLRHRLLTGGLDRVWTRPEGPPAPLSAPRPASPSTTREEVPA